MLAVLFSFMGITGCGFFGDKDKSDNTEYTIMYTDGNEIHTLTVRCGELYSIPKPLPQKEGHVFLGFFDAETGGTQYVNSSGMCIAAFNDKKNIVLFPQFAADRLTVNLDYGISATAGTETIEVEYGQNIPFLPSDLVADNSAKYIFDGWFTKPNCGGIKVAGANGISDKKAEDIAKVGEISVKLYAGFRIVTFAVTFYDCKDFTDSWTGYDTTPLAVKQIEYGSLLSEVAPKKRKNGQKILGWSSYENSSEYTSDITQDMNFYVREYEITVSYDSAGGEKLRATVSGNRDSVNLKTPKRLYYEFDFWQDDAGNPVGNRAFATDVTLTAHWTRTHYEVSFNTNGGQVIKSIYVKAGDEIVLPNAEKICYKLVGWKYQNKIYKNEEKMVMPANNVSFAAQWEKISNLVTYVDKRGNFNNKSDTVKIGDSFSLPVSSAAGYEFKGWEYNGKVYTGTFTPTSDLILEAVWEAKKYTVTLDANGGKVENATARIVYDDIYSLSVPIRTGYRFIGWYSAANKYGIKLTDEKGKSLQKCDFICDKTLYAVWITDYMINMNRQNCKDNNGYNPAEQGKVSDSRINDVKAHSHYNLIELHCKGCVKNSDGTFYNPAKEPIVLSVKVLQDQKHLPTESPDFPAGYYLSWTIHYLAKDTYKNSVFGTNINGQPIGYGAYYIKTVYTDGTVNEMNKVDFLNGAKKGDLIDLKFDYSQAKTISDIEVVFVYEVYYDCTPWWSTAVKSSANWRCSTILKFN